MPEAELPSGARVIPPTYLQTVRELLLALEYLENSVRITRAHVCSPTSPFPLSNMSATSLTLFPLSSVQHVCYKSHSLSPFLCPTCLLQVSFSLSVCCRIQTSTSFRPSLKFGHTNTLPRPWKPMVPLCPL